MKFRSASKHSGVLEATQRLSNGQRRLAVVIGTDGEVYWEWTLGVFQVVDKSVYTAIITESS